MSNGKFFFGYPKDFKGKFFIYPPLIKDVIGNDNYSLYYKILTISQEDIEDMYKDEEKPDLISQTPFQFLMNNCEQDKIYKQQVENAFLFFTKRPITFLFDIKAILIGRLEEVVKNIKNLNELILLKEEDFFEFQNMVRNSTGEKDIEPPKSNEDPRIKRIKAKARYRDKIKAKKGGGISLETMLAALCCLEIGLNPINIQEITLAAAMKIFNMCSDKEKYENAVRSLLAGAKKKDVKLEYWIKND